MVGYFVQLPTKMLERHRLGISLIRFDIFWYVPKRFLVLRKTSSYKVRLWSSSWISVKQHFNGSWMFTLEWWTPQAPREKWKKNPNHEKPWIIRLIPLPSITILITKINETLRNNLHWLCFGGIYEESFQLFSHYWIFTVFGVKKSNFPWKTVNLVKKYIKKYSNVKTAFFLEAGRGQCFWRIWKLTSHNERHV